ncbi:hypothetical protein PC119_g13350 [Phytophthora cactorum]|nr:hypothetical protein PC119_g13350 [Phytophthora cactorum]
MEELVNGVTAELSTASDGESDCEGEPLVDKDKEPEVDETAVKLEVCTNIVVPLDVEGVVATVMVDLPSPESVVCEDDWKIYFLDARNPGYIAYKQLSMAMKDVPVDAYLQDAEPRVSRLLADFYNAVDGVNMESITYENPKWRSLPGRVLESSRVICGVGAVPVTITEESIKKKKLCLRFPVPIDGQTAIDQAMAALAEGIEVAEVKEAPTECLDEARDLLVGKLSVFQMALGNDTPVDLQSMRIKLKPGATPRARCAWLGTATEAGEVCSVPMEWGAADDGARAVESAEESSEGRDVGGGVHLTKVDQPQNEDDKAKPDEGEALPFAPG